MARYYFHFEHACEVRDEAGVELPDIATARCHAVQMIAETLCHGPQAFWDADQYRVTVALGGLTLFSVEMVAAMAPMLRKTSLPAQAKQATA